jgi:hypothetical protein
MNVISAYCIIRDLKVFSSEMKLATSSTGFNDFRIELYEALRCDYPKFYKMDAQCQLGFLASEVLLKSFLLRDRSPDSTAIVLTNAEASLDTDLRYQESSKAAASPSLFVYTLPNIVIGEICIRNNIQGENSFFITRAFDSKLLSFYVDQILLQSHIQTCIAGWVNVLNDQHDVFLYLVEKQNRGCGYNHTSAQLDKLYNS